MRTVREKREFSEYLHGVIDLLNRVLAYNQDFMTMSRPDIKSLTDELADCARLRIEERHGQGLDMLDFALALIRNARFAAYGDPMKGVQIIGLLEARNLDFDCVILPSMNEGIFPKRSDKDLFINQAVRKEVGLPHDKERENLFYYYFTELTQGKKEVYLSYVEEESRDVRSRFIDFLVEQGRTTIDQKQFALERAAIRHGTRAVAKGPQVFSRLRTMVSGRGVSPTHLKDYRECPYRFYLKYLLGMREPEQIIEEPGALEWGSALHQALQYLYKYDVPRGFTENDIPRVKELLDKRLTAAIRGEVARIPKKVMQFDLELLKKRMEQFLKNEVVRFEEGFHVVTEKLEERVKGSLPVGDIPVNFLGFPDRIDEKNSKRYVLDYKSKAPPKKHYTVGPDFKEFQLPLYAFMISAGDFEKIGGIGYYDLSKDVRVVYVADEETIVGYLNDFKKEILIPALKELLDPNVSFSQARDRDACRYCTFVHVCGIKNV
jgi:RecB family exonuclease